ncbi:MAG: hypothetical protein QNK51_01545 [Chitinophagales bacterium]
MEWKLQNRWKDLSTGKKIFVVIIILWLAGGIINRDSSNSVETSMSVETNEGTKSCLIGVDWIYPSSSNPTGAWKFSLDGTFNSSTTAFGGMSAWGNWSVLGPGKIEVSYTRTTEGTIPSNQILTMSSCGSLKVGSTNYSKY